MLSTLDLAEPMIDLDDLNFNIRDIFATAFNFGFEGGSETDLAARRNIAEASGHRVAEVNQKWVGSHWDASLDGNRYEAFEAFCRRLGMKATADSVKRYTDYIFHHTQLGDTKEELIKAIRRNFASEVDGLKFLCVESEKLDLWEHPTKEWDEIIKSFPEIDFDVREASNCFALGRYMATVLHTMRIQEVGLKKLWISTKLNPGAKSWGGYIDAIHKYATTKDVVTGDYPPNSLELQEVAAHMGVIKNAWRNRAMHADATFNNETDARDILMATRSVMQSVSKI